MHRAAGRVKNAEPGQGNWILTGWGWWKYLPEMAGYNSKSPKLTLISHCACILRVYPSVLLSNQSLPAPSPRYNIRLSLRWKQASPLVGAILWFQKLCSRSLIGAVGPVHPPRRGVLFRVHRYGSRRACLPTDNRHFCRRCPLRLNAAKRGVGCLWQLC